jgi:ppGpp synthetase/RelA/SpoT-type nucleotidyltranferase
VFAKARRKGLSEANDLLQRCDEKDGRRRFPLPDLLGVRVLVRSLNDVAAVKRALEDLRADGRELYPLGNAEDFDVEDMNGNPRRTGYRALHVDGSVSVRVAERDVTVPFELQVKTLAQHVFGQHTHDEAYVFLLAKVEHVAAAVRADIARRASDRGFDGQAASIGSVCRAPGVTSPVS